MYVSLAGDEENKSMSSANITNFMFCDGDREMPESLDDWMMYLALGSIAMLKRSRERGHHCLVPL